MRNKAVHEVEQKTQKLEVELKKAFMNAYDSENHKVARYTEQISAIDIQDADFTEMIQLYVNRKEAVAMCTMIEQAWAETWPDAGAIDTRCRERKAGL